jgi:hypothetical protein
MRNPAPEEPTVAELKTQPTEDDAEVFGSHVRTSNG